MTCCWALGAGRWSPMPPIRGTPSRLHPNPAHRVHLPQRVMGIFCHCLEVSARQIFNRFFFSVIFFSMSKGDRCWFDGALSSPVLARHVFRAVETNRCKDPLADNGLTIPSGWRILQDAQRGYLSFPVRLQVQPTVVLLELKALLWYVPCTYVCTWSSAIRVRHPAPAPVHRDHQGCDRALPAHVGTASPGKQYRAVRASKVILQVVPLSRGGICPAP
jgi:hypothetical protein